MQSRLVHAALLHTQAAGMIRHLRSLRTMKRDHGWIPTLLEEAENERMHLMTFIKIKQPGASFSLVDSCGL